MSRQKKATFRILQVLPTLFLFLVVSCKHDVEPPVGAGSGSGGGSGTGGGGTGGSGGTCDTSKVYFQQQVLPILLSNCAMSGCHDAASHKEGVLLDTYENTIRTAGIRPGNPGSSELYEVLIDKDPDKRMPVPPRNPLTSVQINLIRKWIEQGALNLSCQQSSCDTTAFAFSSIIRPIIVNKCQGCHIGTAAGGGIDLSTYQGVKAKVTDGRLWGSLAQLPGYSPMPKNGAKLSDCEITAFRKWIENGSPNN